MSASAMPSPTASAPVPSPARAFAGVWRLTFPRFLTLPHLFTVAGLLALLGVISWAMLSSQHGGPDDYVAWIVQVYFTFLVPIFAFINGAGILRDEMEPSTVDYVLTRPVPRVAFVGYKYLSHIVGVQLEFLLGSAVLFATGAYWHAPGLVDAMPLLLLAQVLMVFAFSAFGFFCGALTSRYIIVGVIYGAIVEIGVGRIPTQINRLSMTAQVQDMLQDVIPAGETARAAAAGPVGTSLVVLGFAVASLALAATLFRLRELSRAGDA